MHVGNMIQFTNSAFADLFVYGSCQDAGQHVFKGWDTIVENLFLSLFLFASLDDLCLSQGFN